ncbi:MAG: GNAT family N-acetyltransferase [Actinomycetota bacterium]|nr:GNAT family N-acetyltransferase [Actinomycetota bacterium]
MAGPGSAAEPRAGWERGPVPGDSGEGVLHLGGFAKDVRLVAVGSTVEHECPDRPGVPALYLWAMAVDPQYQRRGVGTELVERLRSIARNRGVEFLWADARESALGFYAKCGATVGEDSYVDEVTGLRDRRVFIDA